MKAILPLLCFMVLFSVTAKAQGYKAYYQGIKDAKIHLLANDYSRAAAAYYQIFETYNFVYARDCYHAVETAVLAKDTVYLAYFIKRAILQGVQLKYLLASTVPEVYHQQPFVKTIFQQKDSLEEAYQANINQELRHEIIKMFTEDQAIRERYYKAILLQRKKIGREWKTLNKKQVERIIEITRTYGFPGEHLIGIDTKAMHPKIIDQNFSAGMPIVLLIHHYSQPNPSYDLILKKQIEKGNLHNEHFATISDFEAAFGKGKYPNAGYYGQHHGKKLTSMMQINQKRAEIGLLSIDQQTQLSQKRYLSPFWKRLY